MLTAGAALLIATAVTLAAAATWETLSRQAELHRLASEGVPVTITVTGCTGLASGTGITTVGYRCRGSFTLDGQRYDEEIHGNDQLLVTGKQLNGVALRAHSPVLYAAPRPPPQPARPANG